MRDKRAVLQDCDGMEGKMEFTGITLLTDDIKRLIHFYSNVFMTTIEENDVHSLFTIGGISIALYSKKAAEQDMEFDFHEYNGTGNVTLNFTVDDVDAEYERLLKQKVSFINRPVVRPWGAKSFQFRDPDGNILTFRKAVTQ